MNFPTLITLITPYTTGILTALERGRYLNETEAVRETVRAYLDGLQRLCNETNFPCVYIHPVPPPSNQSGKRTGNGVVELFNRFLKEFKMIKWPDYDCCAAND